MGLLRPGKRVKGADFDSVDAFWWRITHELRMSFQVEGQSLSSGLIPHRPFSSTFDPWIHSCFGGGLAWHTVEKYKILQA